jgi:steroid delta-isomerase-like uncharacterized protein
VIRERGRWRVAARTPARRSRRRRPGARGARVRPVRPEKAGTDDAAEVVTRKEVLMFDIEKHLQSYVEGNWDAYKKDYDPQAEYVEMPLNLAVTGSDEIVKTVQRWKRAFPDLRATIKNHTIAGDNAFVEIEWAGTHRGPFEGPFGKVEATGKAGTVSAVLIFTLKNDKIMSARHYFDLLTVMLQIGAGARPEVAADVPAVH